MRFVIDTSVFVNPSVFVQFGKSREDALRRFLEIVKKSKHEFYMPPSVIKELSNFVENAHELELVVRNRSPNVYSLYIPAYLLYDLIEEIRKRIDKGLRIAEEYAVKEGKPQEIKNLREKYRNAVRHGIVDSKEDLDVVLLAKELDAVVVSADEGIRILAQKLGCQILSPENFKKFLLFHSNE